ncbi:MAG TPA: thrombospondin type 3 repeat-containing protein, partial [Saprospiraceae bacterium]|nr:thrombospondin type 3 repeat-containing protein [Saprospiraceae bacterium]
MYHKLYSRLRVLAWTGVLFALFLASPTYGQTSSNNCGSCDDQNECTYDFCFLGRCINVPIANCNRSSTQQGSCEDGDPCTINFRDSRTGECRSRPNPNCDEDATRECVLFPPKIRIVCDDNNTLFDESDDVFYFYITTRGEYTSTCYNISGAVNALCLPYGEEAGPFGPFPANGNALQLRVFDQEKPSGNIAVKVLAPKGCNEDHCTLRIEEISVSECVYNQLSRGNRAVANVKVTWINAKSNNQLDIYLGSERRRLTNVPRNGFTTVSFEIPGDGISREVRAGFSYPGTCEDRRRFTAPVCQDNCPDDPNKTEPGICGCGTPDTDTDGDGTPDCKDNCPTDPNKTEPGECGCGVADTDTDGDGTPDCKDNCPTDPNKTEPGACGCGVADTDTDGDGTPDCKDNCPTDPNKTEPGACGCGVAETDCAPPDSNCPGLTTNGCEPQVFAKFDDCNKVTVCSAKDLSNVVLDLGPAGFQNFDTDIKFENLTGKTLMFTSETPIRGVWIKSGCNMSDDCPGCGEYIANPNFPCDEEVIDNCPDDPNKTEPGECGCGVADTDTDGDG